MNKSVKQITIKVHKNFDIPDIYSSEAIDNIQEALWIGATIQQNVRAIRSDIAVSKIQDDLRKEITHLKTTLVDREKELLKDIQELEEEQRSLQEKHISALKSARAETAETVRRELDEKVRSIENRMLSLEDRKRLLEETRQVDIQKAVETERKSIERIVTEKEKEITRMDTIIKSLQETIAKHTDEISKLGGTIQKKMTMNVKQKGSVFEHEFREHIIRAYGTIRDFDIKNTASGGGHEADYVMTIEGEQIMWELKDYGATVPKKEVDKFMRDMKDYKGAKIGVMISRSSDISSYHGAFATQIIDGRLLIFINRYDEWDGGGIGGSGLFQILLQLFRTWWKVYDRIQENSGPIDKEDGEQSEQLRLFSQRIDDTFAAIQKQIEDLKKRRTEWRTHKGRLEDITRWVSGLIEESHKNLEILLNNLRSSDNDNTEESDTLTDDQKRIFVASSDDKIQEWIPLILNYCVISSDADTYIELQELETLVAENKKMSKDTIRTHILRVINEDVVRKKGNKKIICGLVKKT